jgi:uncharacterized OB-fold protein
MTDDTDAPTDPLARDDLTADSPFTLPGFFAALADGDLLAAVCEGCGKRLVPPRPACYACGGRQLHVEEQPKAGTVVSYTEVRTPPSALADRAPYTVAVVELDSGARLTGRVTLPYADVDIGMPVRLTVRPPADDELTLALDHETEWPIHEFDPA